MLNRQNLVDWIAGCSHLSKYLNLWTIGKTKCSGITLQVKRRSLLIVRLKVIKSREDIFCYLSSYLHCSFLWHLVIVTCIYCIIKSSSQGRDLWSYWEHLLVLLRHWIVCKPLNHWGLKLLQWGFQAKAHQVGVSSDHSQAIEALSCCGEVLGIVIGPSLVIVILSKCSISVPNLISLEYLVENRYVHPPSVNFSYRRVDHLSGCRKRALFLYYLVDTLTRSSSLLFSTIVVSKLEADVSPTESQSHCAQQVVFLALIYFE